MEEILRKLNNRMVLNDRNFLLFMDNALSVHPHEGNSQTSKSIFFRRTRHHVCSLVVLV